MNDVGVQCEPTGGQATLPAAWFGTEEDGGAYGSHKKQLEHRMTLRR
jgi:hypothetical protein